mmetsp:Transcript_26567/g.61032  ORF Transcript_26567/g.61032 Transcript_26567/m.61032 type:complete len:971 (+) Transcript_26567:150-3062(+)
MADEENGNNIPSEGTSNVVEVTDLSGLSGELIEEKIDALIEAHAVLIFSKTWCPFCRDVKNLLAEQIGVRVYALEVNTHPDGAAIFKYVSSKYEHHTVPVVFIKGKYVGGCDDTKALYKSGELELVLLKGLVMRKQTKNIDTLETAELVPKERSTAMNPPLWFPNHVNNLVVRMVGLQVFCMSAISAAFYYEVWGRYLAVGLLVDFGIRLCAGSSLSPLGMNATFIASFFKPDFRPGPPKQFAAFCGLFFSFLGTLFYFVDFEGHDIVGAIWMGMLAFAAGLEGFLDFCLGCLFFGFGIQFGLIPDSVYRIYTASRQEIVEAWDYKFSDSNAQVPIRVDTNPESAVALKYQKKTDEWTKDDFDVIRHMQVSYFGMPLALGGLAVAFKIGSDWSNPFSGQTLDGLNKRTIEIPDTWYQVFAFMGAFFFVNFALLYIARAVLFFKKCQKEWDSPFTSPGFGLITITVTLYSFIVYDEIKHPEIGEEEENPQKFARVLWWMGSVPHAAMTVMKFGEWIGRRLEMEHVQTTWMIFPVGLAVSALCAPVVGVFDGDNGNSVGDIYIARFFYSFAWLMWITLFVLTFFKTVTTHNSDDRLRHGAFIWIAAPCILGLAEYIICRQDSNAFNRSECDAVWVEKYFIGIFIFLGLVWASFPQFLFFGQAAFGMGYWTECFALDTLAACACLFYTLNGWQFSQTMQWIFLTIASLANLSAFWHTFSAIIRERGVFTPEGKWGPLSFMKLTHEAFRGNMNTLKHYIDVANVEDDSAEAIENLGLFAAHFNRFCIVHEEHAKHEDEVIFKIFNDYFPEHAKKYNDDHAEDHAKLEHWRKLANQLLNTKCDVATRKAALDELRGDLPAFFQHFEEHLRGEEDNLNPIGRKYLPIALMVQMSRKVWELTDAKKWEIIVPFIILGLPRHPMRIRYLKVLMWALPERAQQIGAIVYRNVDAVMWERLRTVVPEMVPRGAPGWKRYY